MCFLGFSLYFILFNATQSVVYRFCGAFVKIYIWATLIYFEPKCAIRRINVSKQYLSMAIDVTYNFCWILL